METIGIYAFASKSWKNYDFPVDLWLKHSARVFDRVSLATHGDIGLKIDKKDRDKIIITEMEPPDPSSYQFYIQSLAVSQKALDTDWKVLGTTDEFVTKFIDTEKLNRRYAYPIKQRQLYGNPDTELIVDGVFPMYQYRVHHGNREVIKDGGDVTPPYMAHMSARRLFKMGVLQLKASLKDRKTAKRPAASNSRAQKKKMGLGYRLYWGMSEPIESKCFELWHTGYSRNPKAFKSNIKEQLVIHKKEGATILNKGLMKVDRAPRFDYREYRHLVWRNSRLVKVDQKELPEVVRANRKRFDWVKFRESEYSDV